MQLPNWYLKFIFFEARVQERGWSYSDFASQTMDAVAQVKLLNFSQNASVLG